MIEATSGPVAKPMRRVAVIGGGITGLAAAQRLVSSCDDIEVVIFEASRRLGGIIRTEVADGFLMELGPDSFITNKPAAIQLCEEIGFSNQLIATDARYRRSLVLRNGKPLQVPDGFMLMAPAKPMAILTTPILSLFGKLRLLGESLISRRISDDDESLGSFVRRRFGQQALERLVQPLVAGIYTADPEMLSLKATMPRFLEMERTHGSVIRATLAQQRKDHKSDSEHGRNAEASGSGARYSLFATAAGGLSDLVAAIESALKKSGRVKVQLGADVTSVMKTAAVESLSGDSSRSLNGNAWEIHRRDEPPLRFDSVIVTLPTYAAANLLNSLVGDRRQLIPARVMPIRERRLAIELGVGF